VTKCVLRSRTSSSVPDCGRWRPCTDVLTPRPPARRSGGPARHP
jgi:hypothetical protein